jgi:hypothetical protein
MPSQIRSAAFSSFLPTLDTLREDHLIQQLLCNDLEVVADKLPELPSLPEIRRLCDRIQRITSTHFPRAENILGTLPVERRPSRDALDKLHGMHLLDETHAQDLVSALWQQARLRDRGNIGQLSYMLRCFFDGCRRAIALKESWISAPIHLAPRRD